jgi:hypothetical protein
MPANLKIWNAEAPQGAGRGAKRARGEDVVWHAVTTLEDGSEEWKWSRDPAKAAGWLNGISEWKYSLNEMKHGGIETRNENGSGKVMGVLRTDEEVKKAWRRAVELARARAEKRERELEAELARANKREAHNQEELALRRLMRTTMKRLGIAVNRAVVDEKELVRTEMKKAGTGKRPRRKKAEVMLEATLRTRMVTTRELAMAFKEFLTDVKGDKGLKGADEYRTWLWTDRNTVYLAPAGRRKRGGQGAGGRVTGSGERD